MQVLHNPAFNVRPHYVQIDLLDDFQCILIGVLHIFAVNWTFLFERFGDRLDLTESTNAKLACDDPARKFIAYFELNELVFLRLLLLHLIENVVHELLFFSYVHFILFFEFVNLYID